MAYKVEKIVPFSEQDARKGKQVESMFDEIAPQYDRLNRMMSFGLDKIWRKKGISKLKAINPQNILDIATGTGDLAIQAYRILKPQSVLGIDISEGMMKIGREKVATKGLTDHIRLEWQDCTDLQLESESFDAAMVAFGVRNFEELDKGLQNILRVLRPGGQLMILELSTPEYFPMKQAYFIYSRFIIPLLGRCISKSQEAYKYLPKSIAAFPQNKALKAILKKNGFSTVQYKKLFPGVCTLYLATK
ncbi:bifunctional demethylmenaquinone methyltransferase/2-methoxy-6-polyprenyl-1,4-benzoquinol methylase UbiE [Porphyromonadaceae bacterium OttesenSCG-928-L07]|nr:bifunctional demethylmenaquinone methyltransferase/2-methoxy-6-polyprenyl-1,4-benzoquinol methylase UbiE [Porphyromonadaceae bacterium OttesenSCG-928-L07]MDL2251669.1 bifunctional demethylmenaquinone methyltransferase/2-methoxy-6-polyprenyl-1,4-benzoquinol methylase UbiE [Odoribacter sp. OttesenSCG-928-J03]